MLTTNKKLFDEQIDETWSVMLSDQETIVDLRENGREQRVTYEDRIDYVRQALYTRLTECSLQCEAIKRGIAKIIPEALLNMVTYNELETWVCGKAIVDVDLLKRHTKYGGDKENALNEESRRVKWFWEVLREFSQEEK
jgi:HECT-domain (ubiquitin-transferase)